MISIFNQSDIVQLTKTWSEEIIVYPVTGFECFFLYKQLDM